MRIAPMNRESILHIAVLVVGLGTCWAWTDSCFFLFTFLDAADGNPDAFLALNATGLLSSAAAASVAIASREAMRVLGDPKIFAALSMAATLGVIAASSLAPMAGGAAMVGVLAISGFSMALALVSWMLRCFEEQLGVGADALVAGALVAGGCLELLIANLGHEVSFACIAILPLAGALLYVFHSKEEGVSSQIGQSAHRSGASMEEGHANASSPGELTGFSIIVNTLRSCGLSWRLVLGVMIFGAATGLAQLFFQASTTDSVSPVIRMQLTGRFLIALIVFAGSLLLSRKFSLVYRVGMLLIIAGFLPLPFIPKEMGFVIVFMTNAGFTCLELMVLAAAAEICGRNDVPPSKVVGVVRLVVTLPNFIGLACGCIVQAQVIDYLFSSVLSSFLVFALVLTMVLVISEKPGKRAPVETEEGRPHEEDERRDADAEALAAVSAEYGLTTRERDVLILLVRGRSAPYIANELGIALSTVNSHVRHIYEKAGVHSKQELLDEIEQLPTNVS